MKNIYFVSVFCLYTTLLSAQITPLDTLNLSSIDTIAHDTIQFTEQQLDSTIHADTLIQVVQNDTLLNVVSFEDSLTSSVIEIFEPVFEQPEAFSKTDVYTVENTNVESVYVCATVSKDVVFTNARVEQVIIENATIEFVTISNSYITTLTIKNSIIQDFFIDKSFITELIIENSEIAEYSTDASIIKRQSIYKD